MTRYGIGVLAYLVPTFILGYAWHLEIFTQHYAALAIYRPDVIVPFGFAAMLIQGGVFAWIYLHIFARAPDHTFEKAIGYTALGAVLSWSFTTLAVAAKHRVTSVADFMLIETAFTMIQWIIVGPLTAYAVAAKAPRVR